MVDRMGIEPTTYGLQSHRSPIWATSPYFWIFMYLMEGVDLNYRRLSSAELKFAAINHSAILPVMVHLTRLELAPDFSDKHLKLACLPIPPQVQLIVLVSSYKRSTIYCLKFWLFTTEPLECNNHYWLLIPTFYHWIIILKCPHL